MKTKASHIIITILVLGCIGGVWSFMRYQAKRELLEQFNSDLALRFNDIMDATYPLIADFATALNNKADSIEAIAERSKANKERNYSDAFSVAWEQYLRTPDTTKVYAALNEYQYFNMSPVYTMLTNSGDQRKDESEALQKLTLAGQMLKEPYFLEYDSVMSVTHAARQHIADCMEVMEPYRSQQTKIQAWRNVTPEKYFKMFEKYNKKD